MPLNEISSTPSPRALEETINLTEETLPDNIEQWFSMDDEAQMLFNLSDTDDMLLQSINLSSNRKLNIIF